MLLVVALLCAFAIVPGGAPGPPLPLTVLLSPDTEPALAALRHGEAPGTSALLSAARGN